MPSITFTDDTPTASTYSEISTGKKNEYLYQDDSCTLDEARTCRLSHQIATTPNGVNQHLVQMLRTDESATEDISATGGVHIVIKNPKQVVTSADLLLEWEKLKNKVDEQWDRIVAGLPFSA